MIGNSNYSIWGIKDSGEDITNEIMDIVHSANSFIIIGGYNFSFRGMGVNFFAEIVRKAQSGVPVLMIFPPYLFGRHNPQPRLINFCLLHNIGVILNHHNHSKWLMTENDLYYGSSNFTPTSWRDRVEVVTIHRHRNIVSNWKRPTILDFRHFVQREIADLTNPRRHMHTYPTLSTLTINTWNNILPLIRRLNPSIEKVKDTLQNYEEAELMLKFIVEEWFKFGNAEDLEQIYEMNSKILGSIDAVCEFGYAFIYNESTTQQSIESKRVIDGYNKLHSGFEETVKEQIDKLQNMSEVIKDTNMYPKNLSLLAQISEKISKNNNNFSG